MNNPNNGPKNDVRKHYSATFKAQVVVEALREAKSIAQIASDHQLHPNLVTKWKQEALAELPTVFERRNSQAKAQDAQEQKMAQLYAIIPGDRQAHHAGELAQKKSGLEPDA